MILRRNAPGLLLLASIVWLAAFPVNGQDLLLVNANLIDGGGGPPQPGVSILLRDGRIARVGAGIEPEGAEVRDLGGRWLLPGLIDSHAHLSSPEAADRALRSGVTTMRVLGTGFQQGLALRDLIRAGHVEGPELLVSGGIVRPVLGEPFIMAFPQFGAYLHEPLKGPENVAEVVRTLLKRGVDVIKVGATERAGLASTDPRKPELTREEIEAAVAEAARYGKHVAAHAHGEGGAEAAVLAGVRSIEHGTYLSDASLEEMKARGTWLVPTLAVMSPLGDPPGSSADAVELRIRLRHMRVALRQVVAKAHRLGIPIAASTDGSYAQGDETAEIRVAHDILELIGCGLSPMEAIVAATRTGAQLLGVADRTGVVAEGLEADLMVVDRNPLEDPTTLLEPLLVINNGKVVLDR